MQGPSSSFESIQDSFFLQYQSIEIGCRITDLSSSEFSWITPTHYHSIEYASSSAVESSRHKKFSGISEIDGLIFLCPSSSNPIYTAEAAALRSWGQRCLVKGEGDKVESQMEISEALLGNVPECGVSLVRIHQNSAIRVRILLDGFIQMESGKLVVADYEESCHNYCYYAVGGCGALSAVVFLIVGFLRGLSSKNLIAKAEVFAGVVEKQRPCKLQAPRNHVSSTDQLKILPMLGYAVAVNSSFTCPGCG
ncbi:hypothetical protein Tco_1439607 [Tanacetum coccineum]